ncbi:class I SAM-dependent methyltransferase [Candidatus Sumerlaeota bacterium]|nr:class I SAM-dependent methyltransferase [Candidatus Sumerlaeota bacterium]
MTETWQKIIREMCRRLSPLTERLGFVLSPTHFYFPIPDLRELIRDDVWARESQLAGVELNLENQKKLLSELAKFGDEVNWPDRSRAKPGEYAWDAPTFGYSSAVLLHAMLRHFKPARAIEVGCGWSTLVFAQAIALNTTGGKPCQYTGIDPFPPEYLSRNPAGGVLFRKRLQDVDPSLFEMLEPGDILFIDSSHVLNIGSDVQRIFLEIIPRVKPGVILHVHDIQMPDEYPRDYALGQRWFWNEQYLLQAFLAFNSEFEVLLAGHYLTTREKELFVGAFPGYDAVKHGATGSFWMRRRG